MKIGTDLALPYKGSLQWPLLSLILSEERDERYDPVGISSFAALGMKELGGLNYFSFSTVDSFEVVSKERANIPKNMRVVTSRSHGISGGANSVFVKYRFDLLSCLSTHRVSRFRTVVKRETIPSLDEELQRKKVRCSTPPKE